MGKTLGPSDERLTEIAELAEGITEELFPDEAVDPETIIHRKRITLSRGSYGDAFPR